MRQLKLGTEAPVIGLPWLRSGLGRSYGCGRWRCDSGSRRLRLMRTPRLPIRTSMMGVGLKRRFLGWRLTGRSDGWLSGLLRWLLRTVILVAIGIAPSIVIAVRLWSGRRPLVSVMEVAIVRGSARMIPIPVGLVSRLVRPIGLMGIVIAIRPRPMARITRAIVRRDGKVVGIKAVADVADITRKIGIHRISGWIEGHFLMRQMFRPVDGELEAAVECQLGANDLIRVRGALDQIFATVDVSFRNQVRNDVAPPLIQLFRSQLMRFIHQGQQGCGGTLFGWTLLIFIGGAAGAKEDNESEKQHQRR